MNLKLVKTLVDRGIIRQDTEIEATYNGVDLAGAQTARTKGAFAIRGVRMNIQTETVFFDTVDVTTGRKRTITDKDVLTVDGMDIVTLASVYGVDWLGQKVEEGKRRGRKPRNRVPEAASA